MHFSESLALKAVSLLLALILWITILGFKPEQVRINVKLEPLLAPGTMITNKIPSYVQFTLSGPRVLLKDVQKKIQPIIIELRGKHETTVPTTISEDQLGELPATVHVTGIYPANFVIHLEEVVERYIPVKPTFKGSAAEGYEVASVKVTPAKVAVSGPESLLRLLDSVGTEPFDVQDLGKGSREGVVAVEVDASQGFQLSREKVVHVLVKTKHVPEH